MPRAAPAFPRHLTTRLREALRDSPAVLIHGPRQSGKTTLARAVGEPRGCRYVSFDDEAVRAAARADPVGFVHALPTKCILDEVQRVPDIFTSLKVVIDQRWTAGRFILTGSANVLVVPALAESLAGRMAMLRLHPLSQVEIESARPRFLDSLLRGGFKLGIADRLGGELARRIVAGGYPAALARRAPARSRAWYRDYVETQIQRDVRDLSRLRSFDALPRLLTLAASQTATLINVTDLAAPAGVEVKAAGSVGEDDLRGLRKLKSASGKRFIAGVVLYDGSATVNFGDGLFAVPLRRLWDEA